MGVSKTQVVKFIRKGDTGVKGDKGATLRGPQAWSDCATGYAFKAGGNGEEWKDVVLYNGDYYSCVKSHTKTASNYPGSTTANNNGYWQLGDKIELVATKILLATYALVENLGVTAIDMKDSAGNIIFQAKNGNVTCKSGTFENVKIKGSVRNPFSYVGDSFSSDYSDNVVMLSNGGSWIDAYSLPWDVGQSGRRVTIVNYKWGSTTAEGQAGISAPKTSGKYFYENGISKSELKISREAVELLGYGTPTQFYGWIVLRRTDLMTTYRYGRELKVLAHGRVTGGGSSAAITYRTFDGTTMSVVRNNTGKYTVSFSNNWYYDVSHVMVVAIGEGYVLNGSNAIKAGVTARTKSSFTVETSDDASNNDGNFSFFMVNLNDWIV